jgi:phosphatidylglycerophosphatase A
LSGPSPVAERPSPAGLGSQLARWIATAGGLGYVPFAPGTVTSLPIALAVWWLQPGDTALLGATAVVSVVGVWAAGREEERAGVKDPRAIVIDEVAGMLIACCGHPRTLPWVLGLFLAFRVFDVLKPFGIDRLQALPGGLGVVADDLLAGVYANLLGQLRHFV